MTKIIYIITFGLLNLTTYGFGQTELLRKYNFDEGGYYILGVRSESDHNGLSDSLGEFYTADIRILNAIKKEWVFKKPSPKYACGYHYEVIVCKNGIGLESFSINLNCNEIVSANGYFYFDSRQLRMFKDDLKRAYRIQENFSSLNEARDYRSKVVTQPTLIFVPTPEWTNYEGTFEFTFFCQGKSKDCRNNERKLLETIKAEISQAYPDEPFELDLRGGSTTELFIAVKSNKSLADKFTLYKRDLKLDG